MDYRILPPEEIIETTVQLPLSKSISARQLLIDAISGIPSASPLAECDDIESLRRCLAAGNGQQLNVGASGTALRFLTAYYAATDGADVVIAGDPASRLNERPVGLLVDALRSLGAEIEYLDGDGHAPLHIKGHRLTGGDVAMDASVSSQFVSALMMVGPTMEAPLKITLLNNIASAPYIKMTAAMMERRGARVEIAGQTVTVEPGNYTLPGGEIERDWSAASYWYSLVAISAGWVTLPGLIKDSLQGDSLMLRYGAELGVVTDFDDEDAPDAAVLSGSPEQYGRLSLDMAATPDLVPALAVAASTLGIPFRFTGVKTLHDKECDRIDALCREALKLGAVFETEGADILYWEGNRHPITELPLIDTYADHRMAMAFAPVSVFLPGMVIRDVEVVNKSYPGYWDDLRATGFTLLDPAEAVPEQGAATE